jgi:hypothetical protein
MPRSTRPTSSSKPPARPSRREASRPKPSVADAPRKESLEAFTERARESLRGLTKGRDEQRAARDAEREEVGRALKLALNDAPELKRQLDRMTKALKAAREREDEVEARLAKLVKAGLAELDELTERHLR